MLESIYKMTQKELFNFMIKGLKLHYENVISSKDNYIYCVGDIPIMLVAHLDTVYNTPPKKINFKDGKYSSPQGLGSDDRSGINAIIDIIKKGYHPSILLCCDEEIGGIGAKKASKDLEIKDVNILIELDRKGYKNFVTYDCENEKMDNYIENFGIEKEYGSFSDISFLCPAFGIGGVNIGIGYYNQHSKGEYLIETEYQNTVNIICDMLDNPPSERFEYIEEYKEYRYNNYRYDRILSDTIEIGIDDLCLDDPQYEEFIVNIRYYKELAIEAIEGEINRRWK